VWGSAVLWGWGHHLTHICSAAAAAHALLLHQVYDILNSLEDRLGVTNSAVVLAAIKVSPEGMTDCSAAGSLVA
jgi:hypothetical protein